MTWKLAWTLKKYKLWNSMVRFSKYKFYNKLLGGVTLLRVTLGVTWAVWLAQGNLAREEAARGLNIFFIFI